MQYIIRKIIPVVVALLFVTEAGAMKPARYKFVVDSLQSILPRLTTPEDSLKILYDLMDVAPVGDRADAAIRAYVVARRTDDIAARGDLLRRIANYSLHSDSLQTRALEEAVRLPKGEVRDETTLFIKLIRITTRARYTSGEERQRTMKALIGKGKGTEWEGEDDKQRFYDNLERLYALCIYMGLTTHGGMLVQYVDSLGSEIEKLPPYMQSLRNLYYTNAAITYTTNDIPEKAVEADKTLLKIVDNMESINRENGREFSNYDVARFNSNRRILSNYKVLTDDEIDYYYNKTLEIGRRSATVASEIQRGQRIHIYNLMAKKRYEEVLPILKSVVDLKTHEAYRRQFLRYMIEAAKATGDEKTLLEASQAYIGILESFIKLRADESLRELQVVYDLNSLMDENYELRQNSINNSRMRQKSFSLALVALAVVIAVMVLMAVVYYYRNKKLANNLRLSNESLKNERDNLRRTQDELIKARDRARQADRHKTDFINNMSHEVSTPLNTIVEYSQLIVDSVDEKKHAYLERFAQAIDVSADLLRTLIHDVLDMASLENSQLSVVKRPVSVKLLCDTALATRNNFPNDKVKMIFDNADDAETVVITDRRRVEQVLINMLSNAAKFTEEGSIHMGYKVDRIERTVTFYVEDTGIGIPPAKREAIFERFVKLSRFTQGNGLGLSICRMIAQLLGGKIWVDPDYPGPGSRFCFRIPMD